MIRRPPRSTQSRSSAASDVYKRQEQDSERPPVSPGAPQHGGEQHVEDEHEEDERHDEAGAGAPGQPVRDRQEPDDGRGVLDERARQRRTAPHEMDAVPVVEDVVLRREPEVRPYAEHDAARRKPDQRQSAPPKARAPGGIGICGLAHAAPRVWGGTDRAPFSRGITIAPPTGFEPALPPPEGGALSPELRGPAVWRRMEG